MPPSKPRDGREFVRVSVTLPDDPKLLDTTDVPRCLALYVVGLTYARRHKTDGVLRPDTVVHDARVPKRLTAELVRVGLWHEPGHPCDRCDQPPAGRVIVHDYLEHNQSGEEIDAAREAGRKAAEARWSGRSARNGKVPDRTAVGNAGRNAHPNADRIRRSGHESASDERFPSEIREANERRSAPVDNVKPAGRTANRPHQKDANPNADRNAEAEVEAEVEVEVEAKSLLLTCVSRLAGSDARAGESLPADLIAAWRDTAPPGTDLVAEARAYLAHYADRPATNERAAWLGWLKRARPPAPAARRAATCPDPDCHGGWLPQLPGDDRPRPCPTCKPHIRTA
jgi:hypothetical protein